MEIKSKKSIIIVITSLLVLATLMLLGLTYAYYRTRIVENTAEKSISVSSKKLEITYQNESAYIEASGIKPGYSASKTFEVYNSGDETVNFSIMLDNITNTFTRASDWTFTLKEGTTILKTGKVPQTKSFIYNSVKIASGETKSYSITINYANLTDVNQSIDMGKSLSLRINIGEEVKTTFNSAAEGTLLAAIGNDNIISEPLTVPGQAASLDGEAVFASTEGVNGDTYYFRGSVENNYVTYSGMCWRIVRVMENGDIKLALADRDNACGTVNGYEVDDVDGAFVADPSSQTFAYKYGTYSSTAYVYKKSDVAAVLKAWAGTATDRTYTYYYEDADYILVPGTGTFTNPTLDTTKLSTTPNWCIDTSEHSKDDLFMNYIDYGAYGRLKNKTTAQPSLNCASALENESQIGILSVDEVAFAGSASGTASDFYLKTNATADGYGYWTLSPSYEYISNVACVWCVLSSGSFISSGGVDSVDGGYSIRPAVVLDSSVTITSGNGTIDTPYVID